MFLFLQERNTTTGFRVSHENFTRYDRVQTVPIYAVNTLLS